MDISRHVSGMLWSKLANYPFYVRFHVTRRCNYRCRMCGFHKTGNGNGRELTIPEIEIMVDRLAGMKVRNIVITGGEPFLRNDLPDIVAIFNNYGFSVRIQTNGGPQVTNDMLVRCASAGLREISVSIDTLNKSLQDEICNSSNVVDNALRTLRMSRNILPNGISQANVVASKYNFEELIPLVKFFYSLGVYIYITPVMVGCDSASPNSEYIFRGQDESFVIDSINFSGKSKIIDELIVMRRSGMGITNSTRFLRDYREYLSRGRCARKCEAGILSLDILEDGSVCICKEKPPIGNMLDDGFLRFYRSKEYYQLVREVTTSCAGCFYGEYREPLYAVRDLSVLAEWVRDWYRVFRHGMSFEKHEGQ